MDEQPPVTETSFKHRRWTVISSALLCGVLALVVLFTSRGAFHSLWAVIVVAAIGAAAVLLQLQLRHHEKVRSVHIPLWLNTLGIVLALAALFADFLRITPEMTQLLALGAVGSFAVGGAMILHVFRKRAESK